MIAPFQIYRHFKGGLYLVLSLALDENTKEPLVVYLSLNGDNKVWSRSMSEFSSFVPEGKENPTGQINRFQLVQDIKSCLKDCTTENLIKELKSRPDNPFNDIDLEGFNDRVVTREYAVGEIRINEVGQNFLHPVVYTDSIQEAKSFIEKHPDRCSSRTNIYKVVISEAETFD